MRLKVTSYDNTKSRVFALTIWNSEVTPIPNADRLLGQIGAARSVVDQLHGLLLLANEVEKAYARTEETRKARIQGADVQGDAVTRSDEPVSV